MLSLKEYREEIKELQANLPKGAELEWSSNDRWVDGVAIPNFKVKKKYDINGFVVYSSVSIQVRNFVSVHDFEVDVSTSGYFDHVDAESMSERVELLLEKCRNQYLDYVEGFVDTKVSCKFVSYR